MPTRVIREGLLSSERYHALSDAARLAFFEILLVTDDWGLVDLGPVRLRMVCPWAAGKPAEAIARVVSELADADLIRCYEVEGARFGFVPRFNNPPRARRPKYPDPPLALCTGTAWASGWPALRAARDAQAPRSGEMPSPWGVGVGHVGGTWGAGATETETETATAKKSLSGREARGVLGAQAEPMAPAALLFAEGVAYLEAAGSSAKAARGFLGMMRKRAGDAVALRVLRQAMSEPRLDPCGWLKKALEDELATDPRRAAAEARALIEAEKEKAGLQ